MKVKYRLFSILRFIAGFFFCLFFFKGFVRFYCLLDYWWPYITSLSFAFAYLFFSYAASHYKRRYFLEMKTELSLKVILFLVMYGSAIFLHNTFEFTIDLQHPVAADVYFLMMYFGFDMIADFAIEATSYHSTYNWFAYWNKTNKILRYIEHQNSIGNKIDDKIGYSKRSLRMRDRFIPFNVFAYDFFADNDGELVAFYESDFYEELMQFSKENQLFYGKKIDDENYILDSRCNKVCITKDKFSFYDHNGRKCIFTMKFDRTRKLFDDF